MTYTIFFLISLGVLIGSLIAVELLKADKPDENEVDDFWNEK